MRPPLVGLLPLVPPRQPRQCVPTQAPCCPGGALAARRPRGLFARRTSEETMGRRIAAVGTARLGSRLAPRIPVTEIGPPAPGAWAAAAIIGTARRIAAAAKVP